MRRAVALAASTILVTAGVPFCLRAQSTTAPDTPPVQPPASWVPQATAVLRVLNKIDAASTVLTVKVGSSARFGALTIGVQSCMVRPPDAVQDAASYLVITDSRPDEPGFQGWMLAKEPWVSMLQSPVYDVRLVGCRA